MTLRTGMFDTMVYITIYVLRTHGCLVDDGGVARAVHPEVPLYALLAGAGAELATRDVGAEDGGGGGDGVVAVGGNNHVGPVAAKINKKIKQIKQIKIEEYNTI